MTTSEYISKIQDDNYLLAICNISKYKGNTLGEKLVNAKLKYEQRPFDGAWEDIKVMILYIEKYLNV